MNEEFWNSSLQELFRQPILNESFDQAEVIELLGIKPYQLRFWESEFDCIRSQSEQLNARYSTFDMKILCRIKKFLMEDQLTIEKAKALIDSELKKYGQPTVEIVSIEPLEQLQMQLADDLATANLNNDSYEDSMNMNALYEEMSLETFQQMEAPVVVSEPVIKSELEIQQVKIRSAIEKIRERLKSWSR